MSCNIFTKINNQLTSEIKFPTNGEKNSEQFFLYITNFHPHLIYGQLHPSISAFSANIWPAAPIYLFALSQQNESIKKRLEIHCNYMASRTHLSLRSQLIYGQLHPCISAYSANKMKV